MAALATVPILVREIGPQQFGAYTVLTGLGGFVSFIDSGFGSGIRTRATETEQDPSALGRTLGSGLAMLSIAAGAIAVVALLLYLTVPWNELTGSVAGLATSSNSAAAWTLVAFVVSIPSLLLPRALEGLGYSHVVALCTALPGLATLAGVVLVTQRDGDFVAYVAAYSLAVLALPLGLIAFTRGRWPPFRMSVGRAEVLRIWLLSWPMMIIGIALSLSYMLDSIVIAVTRGASDVAEYAVANRLVQLGALAIYASAPVLWTHFVRARADGDVTTSRVLRMSRQYLLASVGFGVVLVAAGPALTDLWTSGEVVAPRGLFVAAATWLAVLGYQLPLAMAQNDRDGLIFQARSTSVMALVNVGLSLVLVRHLGSPGPVWASAVALFACHLVPLDRRLRRATRASAK